MLKVDFHLHTADDPWDRIPHTALELIDRASELEFDAIAITLHDRQWDPAPLANEASRRGITLIPGIERTIHGRHVLLINFPDSSVDVRSFEDLAVLKANHPRGLVIAPHPFFPLGNCLRELAEPNRHLFDAVEYNGCHATMLNFNRAAVRWARAIGKPLVGASDTHRLQVFGSTYSLVNAPTADADAICEAVRLGRVEPRTQPLSPFGLAVYLGQMLVGGHHAPGNHATRSSADRNRPAKW